MCFDSASHLEETNDYFHLVDQAVAAAFLEAAQPAAIEAALEELETKLNAFNQFGVKEGEPKIPYAYKLQ